MEDEEVLSRLLSILSSDLPEYSDEELTLLEKFLQSDAMHRNREVTLGIALHFTPQPAVMALLEGETPDGSYAGLEPYEMIQKNIKENYGSNPSKAERIGERLGEIWQKWKEDDRYIRAKEDIIMSLRSAQNERCANCYVRFEIGFDATTYSNSDIYKPLDEFTADQTQPELDHIEPLSKFGGDVLDNYQVLCKFCNQGKGDSTYIPVEEQLENATAEIDDMKPSYRRRVFFATVAKYGECQECGASDTELTVRKKNEVGCFMVSNLEAICIKCAFAGEE